MIAPGREGRAGEGRWRLDLPLEPLKWPAAGFVDTEIRCLTELESWNAETEVQPRVQA